MVRLTYRLKGSKQLMFKDFATMDDGLDFALTERILAPDDAPGVRLRQMPNGKFYPMRVIADYAVWSHPANPA
jgi:hypothetical protein